MADDNYKRLIETKYNLDQITDIMAAIHKEDLKLQ